MLFFYPSNILREFFCVDGVEKVGISLLIYNYKRSVKESLKKILIFTVKRQ